MPEHNHFGDEELFNAETRHEQSDVPIRPLWWALIIFVVFGILTHIVLGFFYKGLVKAERDRMDPPQTAVARPANADVPQNQPLLQPFPRKDGTGAPLAPQGDTPVTDLQKMRAAEVKALTSYGWIDRERGIVRMPIDQAKEALAARLAVQGQTGGVLPTATAPSTAAPVVPGAATVPAGRPVPSVLPAAATSTSEGARP